MKAYSRTALAVIVLCCLSACGWQLRGKEAGALPKNLALSTSDPYAPLARQLQQTLVRRGVTLSASAPIQLYLSTEKRQKRTVAVTSIGATAQYEIYLSVDYAFSRKGEPPVLPTTITSQRLYDFVLGSNLAKTEEEQTLIAEMRQELINRILQNSLQDHNATP